MKIVLIQSGPAHEVLLLSSVLIGLKKKYPKAKILWAGEPKYFPLIKFNKRVKKWLNINKGADLASLTSFYGSEICYNSSLDNTAQKFASMVNSKECHGFNGDGPINTQATFFRNVISGNISTRKTILDIYYSLADMKWQGEGYGLSYYPRQKQTKQTGICCQSSEPNFDGEKFSIPSDFLSGFDIINQYATIVTDDLLVAHMALSLRKKVEFTQQLSYTLNFESNICA